MRATNGSPRPTTERFHPDHFQAEPNALLGEDARDPSHALDVKGDDLTSVRGLRGRIEEPVGRFGQNPGGGACETEQRGGLGQSRQSGEVAFELRGVSSPLNRQWEGACAEAEIVHPRAQADRVGPGVDDITDHQVHAAETGPRGQVNRLLGR